MASLVQHMQTGNGVVKTTGAHAVIETLKAFGVNVIFANPGTTEMPLIAALDDVDGAPRCILCAHETVCSGAADGYARMLGKPACTILHLGVGLANALANLHNAKRACSPVLNLVGTMASWHVNDAPLASDASCHAAIVPTRFRTGEHALFALCKLASALASPTPRCRIVHAGFPSIRA